MEDKLRIGVLKANNQPVATRGLVTTTAGPDAVHNLRTGSTAIIRKIMWYNNTGANVTLIFGTLTNAAVWVPLLPTILCVNTFDGVRIQDELPDVEFATDLTALAGGLTGNILVQASAVGVILRCTIEEFGA